jgi:predicted RNA binding protein YcfA (HicA-like mRNA interferase family)
MRPVSGKRLRRLLERRGWTLIRVRGRHHVLAHPDRPFVVSVPVHGNRDLPPQTQEYLLPQAGLTDADL